MVSFLYIGGMFFMQKNIKKIIVVLCFIFVWMLPFLSVAAENREFSDISKNQTIELNARFIGRIRGGILPTVGYGIDNIGDEIARNITATFTINGGFSDDIHLFDSLEKAKLGPSMSVIKSGIFSLYGFGPLTVTLDIDAENVETIHRTSQGFQIGFCTFIFA
jgi:hypothetical protein